jgi:triacylglycerol lipase
MESSAMGHMLEPTTRPKIIQDPGEQPLVLYSDVRTPLAGLSFLRRSLALAELALIAYNDEAEASWAALAIGFPDARLIEHDGSQAYRFANRHDVVIACRGTEPTEWNDIQADANATLAVVGTMGRVHSGFNQEVNDLWPTLSSVLRKSALPVWFCGHSLGAAMATLCAFRCQTEAISIDLHELHTFGSPRVGCKQWVRHSPANHYRWVHNNDVVTRVPPPWMGYRHCGREMYLDRFGRLRNLKGVWRSRDRWRGLVAGLLRWEIDWLSDHSVKQYARHIVAAADYEEAGTRNRPAMGQRAAA